MRVGTGEGVCVHRMCVCSPDVCVCPDAPLVSAPEHPGGDGLRLQHRKLQALQGGSGRADGAGQAEVPEASGRTVSHSGSFTQERLCGSDLINCEIHYIFIRVYRGTIHCGAKM